MESKYTIFKIDEQSLKEKLSLVHYYYNTVIKLAPEDILSLFASFCTRRELKQVEPMLFNRTTTEFINEPEETKVYFTGQPLYPLVNKALDALIDEVKYLNHIHGDKKEMS